MKKSIFSLVAIVAAAILLVSCSAADSSDPKSVLKAFFEQLAKKDVEGAAKYATSDSKSTLDMMKKALDAAKNMPDSVKGEEDPTKSFKDVVFGEAKVEGDIATVSVSGKDQPAADFTLKKEGGKWKVDFSMATLMKMGQKAAGEMQHGAGDGHNHEGGLADSTLDFNKEQIEQGKQMADSILKNMDPKEVEKLQKQIEEATKK